MTSGSDIEKWPLLVSFEGAGDIRGLLKWRASFDVADSLSAETFEPFRPNSPMAKMLLFQTAEWVVGWKSVEDERVLPLKRPAVHTTQWSPNTRGLDSSAVEDSTTGLRLQGGGCQDFVGCGGYTGADQVRVRQPGVGDEF